MLIFRHQNRILVCTKKIIIMEPCEKKKNIQVIKNIHLLLPSYSSLLQSHSLLAHHFSSVFLFFLSLQNEAPMDRSSLGSSPRLCFSLYFPTAHHFFPPPCYSFSPSSHPSVFLPSCLAPSSTNITIFNHHFDKVWCPHFPHVPYNLHSSKTLPALSRDTKKKKNSWSTKGSTLIQPLSLLILNFYLFNFITSISKGS